MNFSYKFYIFSTNFKFLVRILVQKLNYFNSNIYKIWIRAFLVENWVLRVKFDIYSTKFSTQLEFLAYLVQNKIFWISKENFESLVQNLIFFLRIIELFVTKFEFIIFSTNFFSTKFKFFVQNMSILFWTHFSTYQHFKFFVKNFEYLAQNMSFLVQNLNWNPVIFGLLCEQNFGLEIFHVFGGK